MSTATRSTKLRGALSHVALLLALTAYTAVGGLVFRALEGSAEAGRLQDLQQGVLAQRKQLVHSVLNASRARDPGLHDVLLRQLHEYEVTVHQAARGGVEVPALTASPPSATPPRWTLLQGVFFASTVLTTIGYGNIAPATMSGRAFCLVFALVGIPLTLTVIADLGVLMASAVSALPCWSRCRAWIPAGDGAGPLGPGPLGSGSCRSLLLALGAVLLLFVYLALGAAMFTLWEDDWDFFDGFYFCFITMTTIGFGDLVPRKPSYTLLCTLYILVGLAMTSTIIELVRRQYASSWRRLQEALAVSGPALGEALRRLGSVGSAPDVDLKRLLAAASLAKFAPRGSLRASVQAQSDEWQEAIGVVLRDLAVVAKRTEEEEKRKRKKKRAKRSAEKPRLVEIIFYESTV